MCEAVRFDGFTWNKLGFSLVVMIISSQCYNVNQCVLVVKTEIDLDPAWASQS